MVAGNRPRHNTPTPEQASYDGPMQVAVSASSPGNVARRMAPVVCGSGLAACAAVVVTNNPSSGGTHFPTCAFHATTGLWCPACGLTRGTYQLLHGHITAALSYNLFTPLVLVAIVIAWLAWVPVTWGATPRSLSPSLRRALTTVAPTLVIAYGVLRNIPIEPLRVLAP